MPIFYVVLSTYRVVLSPCGFVLSISGISKNSDWTLDWTLDSGKKTTPESPSSRHLLKFCRKTTKVSSWLQMFEKLRRVKFLKITLSLKDIELGLKSPMKSFPSINLQLISWLRICFLKSKDRKFLSTKPGFLRCTKKDTDLSSTRL